MQELSGAIASGSALLRHGLRQRFRGAEESREAPRQGTLAMRRLARVMSVDDQIKRALLESNGQWLSARQLADVMGVTYQAIARRLFKLALFAEIDMQEIELIKERHRVRKSHLYRAWGGWTVYPSWMAPRGCESGSEAGDEAGDWRASLAGWI